MPTTPKRRLSPLAAASKNIELATAVAIEVSALQSFSRTGTP